MPIIRSLRDWSPDERGQGLAEYALILALIAIVAIVALIFLGLRSAHLTRSAERLTDTPVGPDATGVRVRPPTPRDQPGASDRHMSSAHCQSSGSSNTILIAAPEPTTAE